MHEHVFWWLLTMSCVIWYSTITIYVSWKGIADIRGMLRRLSLRKTDNRTPVETQDGR
jgi:hypothetical protein